jgi:NDP-sugar pyrophosphorylase family protein
MPLTAVVLAAGAGSRLGDLTRHASKPMLPILGWPLIDWVATMLAACGFGRLLVVGHPDDRGLADWVKGRPSASLVLQPERRGIADALAHALPHIEGHAAYLACACDSLYRVSELRALIALGLANAGAAVVGVLRMGRQATASRSAVSIREGHVTDIVEKPAPGSIHSEHVALPLYWLPRSFDPFCSAPAGSGVESYVSTALRAYVQAGRRVLAHPMSERLEITRAEDLAHVEDRLRRNGSGYAIVGEEA